MDPKSQDQKRDRKYLGVLISGTALMLVAFIAADLRFHQSETVKNMAMAFGSAPTDVLFWGDSVIRGAGTRDSDPRGIDQMLASLMDRRVLGVAHPAFSPIAYQDLIDVVTSAPHRPAVMVLPVNLRSFSDEWFVRPIYQFELDRVRARCLAGTLTFTDIFRRVLPAYFGTSMERRTQRWLHTPVSYGQPFLGTPKEIFQRSQIQSPLPLEYGSDMERYRTQLFLLFLFHYMNEITPQHPMRKYLARTLMKARAANIQVFGYITPVNCIDGERFVGNGFELRIRKNAEMVADVFQDLGVPLLDLSSALPAHNFIDKKYVCEHLNDEGRLFVAESLASMIREHQGLGNEPNAVALRAERWQSSGP